MSLILLGALVMPVAGITDTLTLSQTCTPGIDNPTFDNHGKDVTQTGVFTSPTSLCMTGTGKTTVEGNTRVPGSLWVHEGKVQFDGSNNQVGGVASDPAAVAIAPKASLWMPSAKSDLEAPSIANQGIIGGQGTLKGNLSNQGTIVTSSAMPLEPTTIVKSSIQEINPRRPPAWLGFGRIAPSRTFTIDGNLTTPDTQRSAIAFALGPNSGSSLRVTGSSVEVGRDFIVDYRPTPGLKGSLRPTYTLIEDASPGARLTLLDRPHLLVGNAPKRSDYLFSYDPAGKLLLTIIPRNPFLEMGGNANQKAIERYLDKLVPKASGTLYKTLNRIYQLEPSKFQNTLTALDGELHAETPALLYNAVAESWNPVYARMGMNASLGGYDPDAGSHFWMSGTGGFGSIAANGIATGANQHSAGTLLGADTQVADLFTVGLTAGYLSTGANRKGFDNTLNASYWQIGTYGDIPIGKTGHFGLLIGYDQGSVNTLNQSLLGIAKSSQNSRIITAEALGSWRYDLGGGHSISPIIALQSITVQRPGFKEIGLGALASELGAFDGDFVSARFQARYDYQWRAFDIDWTGSLAAGLREMINQPSAYSRVNLSGGNGSGFIVRGNQSNAETGQGLINAGLTGHLTDQFDLELGYRGIYTGSSQFSSFLGNLAWRFDAPKKERIHGISIEEPEIENPAAARGEDNPLTIRDPGSDMANYPNSAFTLPKGGFYLESTPMSYTARSPSTGGETFSGPTLFRYGLFDDMELRLFYTPYQVQLKRKGTVSGSGNLAFDTKIHLWDAWEEFFIPAAGFELTIQTPWMASTAFQSPTAPAFTFNFDQDLPFDIGIEYNLGANYLEDPNNLSNHAWSFSAQWAAQRDITEDLAIFFNGFYNTTTLPRVSRRAEDYRDVPRYQRVCLENNGSVHCQREENVVRVPYTVRIPLANIDSVPILLGGGLIWTLDDHLQLFGNAAAGVTATSPGLQAYVGFGWSP